MTDDRGNLSVDFLAGFTIFLLAFIWVITMIPGLLIGLQAYTIDYDAVAYRTGVILVEDPGLPVAPAWESDRFKDQKAEVIRFGLALSRDTPNILSQDKVNRFFCTTAFSYPEDYHQRAIFGDYPYHFNISFRDLGQNEIRSVGDVKPEGYGYIRRVVKMKSASNATINYPYMMSHSFINGTGNESTHVFSIHINITKLLGDVREPAYQIDPYREQMTINITDFSNLTPLGVKINLTDIKICNLDTQGSVCFSLSTPADYPYVDGSSMRLPSMPATLKENITLRLRPYYFDSLTSKNVKDIFILLKFDLYDSTTGLPFYGTFLNNTQVLPDFGSTMDGDTTFFYPTTKIHNPNTNPFDYNYHSDNVTQPKLRDAVVEVAVW